MHDAGAIQTITPGGPGDRSASSVVDGEITTTVRVIRLLVVAAVIAALCAGVVHFLTISATGTEAVVDGLALTGAALAAILILLGSLVEGFGFGLSLGTTGRTRATSWCCWSAGTRRPRTASWRRSWGSSRWRW